MREITLPLHHEDIIRQQADDKSLDPALIAAVIYEESRFRDQTSHAGARGLMQITPETADFIARRSGGVLLRAGRPGDAPDQHRLRRLVPALPDRPLRGQRDARGRGLQRGPDERRPLGAAGRRPGPLRQRAATSRSRRRAPTWRTSRSGAASTATSTGPSWACSRWRARRFGYRVGRALPEGLAHSRRGFLAGAGGTDRGRAADRAAGVRREAPQAPQPARRQVRRGRPVGRSDARRRNRLDAAEPTSRAAAPSSSRSRATAASARSWRAG